MKYEKKEAFFEEEEEKLSSLSSLFRAAALSLFASLLLKTRVQKETSFYFLVFINTHNIEKNEFRRHASRTQGTEHK